MKYRDSASFGKRQEYSVINELLKRHFDVYMTLVDDQGIDCIIRLNNCQYLDIQIKARSVEAKQWNLFAGMSIEPRENYYFIFYTERDDTYWIIPSLDVTKFGIINKSGKHEGKISLTIPKSPRSKKFTQFEKYKNETGFEQLKNISNNC